MTEQEWLECTSRPRDMLRHLESDPSSRGKSRKAWLAACAMCRRIWNLLESGLSRNAVEVVERHVDGLSTPADRAFAQGVDRAIKTLNPDPALSICRFALLYERASAFGNAGYTADIATVGISNAGGSVTDIESERMAQCRLLRDIFGNPFRPIAVDPGWLMPGVVELARTIYEGRAFDRMRELADALERAGCTNADMLAHCRQPGEHVRGCWVVDLLLNKE
jgi:hypothetical protein